jgi:serine/threonine-protein kinase
MSVAHAHRYLDEAGFEQTGVLHGDLKPSNILVRPGDEPIVLDFMMADVQRMIDTQWQREPEDFSRLTGRFGTTGYMPPEQEHQGIVTTRSDIYSLGVTFCSLFFPKQCRPDVGQLVHGHVPPHFPDEFGHLDELRILLTQMTEPDPEKRPQSMAEVSERIRQLQAMLCMQE